ncbi:SAC3/GANP/Nin1/mts3/eIF-3 p25 family [Musa troglodytarum]|uniref:SAC3/GANP/Nin1/mts3/eIF-3 p25 family n=1 Tax=Musa troglodytarum TaxID=320322 RepID=A0A9E7H5X3_9LILI|nr:SAC3/GANP/Nin1/mts3/eIF-3 p25 family [Musa troglodytarum]
MTLVARKGHALATLGARRSYSLHTSLIQIRARAISYVNYSGYKPHPYPLMHLSKILMIKESDLEDLCHVCGLETSIDEAGLKTLPVKQTKFSLPKSGFRSYSLSAIDDVKRRKDL